jgi:protoporphyrin/coproporphyrin ferrochelatase
MHKSPQLALGILLINTGTPDAPTPAAVRRFLAQFLADRRVIEYPRWLWLPLLYGVILNVRPRRSARLYQRIWTEAGSPILTITQRLRKKLQDELAGRLSSSVQIEIGMRYGSPSIAGALARLQAADVRQIIVLPLFPQYSGTTTGTALEAVLEEIKTWRWMPSLQMISDYHAHPAYLTALADSIRQGWDGQGKLLFSFHGIPQRYIDAGDPYEDQCRRTAALVAERLNLEPESWSLAFQSRFGPEDWLQPYTDQVLEGWGQGGLERLHVVCPGFAIDCLETLDEIENEGQNSFLEAGGGEFTYIPALNDNSFHIKAIADIITVAGNNHEK